MAGDRQTGFGYIAKKSPVHRLCGATKLLMIVMWSVSAMITYDTRFMAVLIAGSFVIFIVSNIKLRDIGALLIWIGVVMVLNSVTIYFFSPEEGVAIYGTRHEITHLFGRYYLTQEQFFYLLNVVMKYFCIIPVALIFIATTEPSEFASSLNKIGISYKIGYAVALALRYIPDIRRDYQNIKQAQQARGVDTTKKAKLAERIKNIVMIVFPLMLSSLSRIDVIANAMELRGFGKHKKRTWYTERPFRVWDYLIIAGCGVLVAVSVYLNHINGGRFYNPFI